MKKGIVAIDFFCGAGGLTKGFTQAGIHVVAGIDNDITAKETYERNNGIPFICQDVALVRPQKIRKILETCMKSITSKKKPHILFSGCAPCQPFSKIKKDKGQDPEAKLLLKFGEFIKIIRPDFVFSENVPQIRNHTVFQDFLKLLSELEYQYTYDLVNVADYGVPQNRRRLVLLATKQGSISFPKPDQKKKTVRDAIGHFPPLVAGSKSPDIPNHVAAKLEGKNLERIKATPADGGDCRTWPKSILADCQKRTKRKGYYDVYGRMAWSQVSPTLTTKCISLSNGRYGHPEQDRAISVREAATIQSFPENYIFSDSTSIAAKHIGNAVPPEFARRFGMQFVNLARKV